MENKSNSKQIATSSTKSKKLKGWMIGLSCVGGAALIGGATMLTISLVNKKSDDTSSGEVTKEHEIVIDQTEIVTKNYNVSCDKTKAKKGDTVKFTVSAKANVKKVPKYLKINNSYYPLNETSEGQYEATVTIEAIEKMVVTVVEEDALETFTVTFMDGATTLSTQSVLENRTAVKPVNPTKAQFAFVEWCSNEECTTPFDFDHTPIIRNTILYAKWQAETQIGTISGGSTLLQFKSDATGSDTAQWVFKTQTETITGATWTIVDKTTREEITGLTIADGKVSWANVAAASYTAIITATKDEISASAEINIISSDHTYKLAGGSALLSGPASTAGQDTKFWSLYQDETIAVSAYWTITKADGTEAPTGVSIDSGKVHWTAETPSDLYELKVTATYDWISYSTNITLNIADSSYSLSGGTKVFEVKPDETKIDAKTWTLTKDGKTVESPNLVIENISSTLTTGSITITDGQVICKNIPVGTHTFDVVAYDTVRGTSTKVAIQNCSVTSTDYTYVLSDGSTLLSAKAGIGGEDTQPWSLYKIDTYATVAPTWTITETGKETAPEGVDIHNGKVSWTADTPSAEYNLTVKAEYETKVYTVNVSLIISDSLYELSGGSTLLNVKPTETKTDTKQWILKKDEATVVSPTLGIGNISPELTSGNISITDGYVTCENIPAGTYTFDVIAYNYLTPVASKKCTVVSTASHIQYGDGTLSPSWTVKDTDAATNTHGFTLYNGETEETDVTWTIDSISPVVPTGSTIEFDEDYPNYLRVENLATGTYTVTINAVQDETTVATMLFTIVSKDTKIALAITGESTLNFDNGLTSNYTVNTTRTVTWSIEDGYTTASKPTIDQTGKVTLANTEDPSGTFTIKAVDSTSSQTATKTVTVTKPEVNSSNVWTYDSTNNWSSVDMDSACGESVISITPVGGTATTVTRDAFNQKIVIGNKVTSIQDGFLNECTNFEQTITFADNSACLNIGDNFLLDCAKFNQTLSLPSTIQHIGSHFLDGCELFNNGNPSTSKFDLPSALETIGSDFLCGCTVFNLQLTIPSTVTFVGDNFMTYCNAMVSKLTINVADPSLVFFVPADPTQSYTCATDSSAAKCYTDGIPIDGTGATEFMAMFTNRSTEPYRNLKASS